LLEFKPCKVKFKIHWSRVADILARPFGNFASFIWGVIQDAGRFFKNLGDAIKRFFQALGDKLKKVLEKGAGSTLTGLKNFGNSIANTFKAAGKFFSSVGRSMNVFKKGFAEVESERSSSRVSSSHNICSRSRDAANSLISFWDCGIGKAFDRHMKGPKKAHHIGGWLSAVGRAFHLVGWKLTRCVIPHKHCSGFGAAISCFPFVTVSRTNLCFFKVFKPTVITSLPKTAQKVDKFFKPMADFFDSAIKGLVKVFGGFTALSVSRSNAAADCHKNASRTYRNYFGIEVYWDMMPMLVAGTVIACVFPPTMLAGLILGALAAIGVMMACICVDIWIIFVRFGSVSGATCGHKWGYGWCCPMWVFAGEWNCGDLTKPPFFLRSPDDYLEKLAFKFTLRLCFLPRWGCGWNTQDSQHNVRVLGDSVLQFGMCHGPGFKFLASDAMALSGTPIAPYFTKQPLHAFATGLCVVLGFNWDGSVQTFFFALFNTSPTDPDPTPKPVPLNLMMDLWCGYIDICFGGGACHRARHKARGGRFR